MDNNGNQVKTRRVEGRDRVDSYVTFGIKDGKGREIGARITTGIDEYVEINPEEIEANRGYSTRPVGVYFYFTPHATRHGIVYGASQNGKYFKTAEEREVGIQKYLTNAKKRAAKAFGKADGARKGEE